ncbi:hypothetical protein G4177_34330 [Corallococcus sp. ZKHCc1 1396]|uniref:Lipoprotein n=1 Tax=Corallococcus soli TaxID=2710757 RepID=A0ABR9PZA3_9BACT|nr:hypothetical protein [Corallococcus soli]MBE4753240.1 hypothetical protein [Corallococcus soli]
MSPHLRKAFQRLLLLGGLVLMTSACGGLDTLVEMQPPDESLELSASEPVAVRRVRMVAAGKPGTGTKVASRELTFVFSRYWVRPPADGSEVVYPWYRLRIVDERDGHVEDEDVIAFGPGSSESKVYLTPRLGPEDPADRFDVTYRLEFERQGPPSVGTIRVSWETFGSVMSDGDEDDVELTVTQSAP